MRSEISLNFHNRMEIGKFILKEYKNFPFIRFNFTHKSNIICQVVSIKILKVFNRNLKQNDSTFMLKIGLFNYHFFEFQYLIPDFSLKEYLNLNKGFDIQSWIILNFLMDFWIEKNGQKNNFENFKRKKKNENKEMQILIFNKKQFSEELENLVYEFAYKIFFLSLSFYFCKNNLKNDLIIHQNIYLQNLMIKSKKNLVKNIAVKLLPLKLCLVNHFYNENEKKELKKSQIEQEDYVKNKKLFFTNFGHLMTNFVSRLLKKHYSLEENINSPKRKSNFIKILANDRNPIQKMSKKKCTTQTEIDFKKKEITNKKKLMHSKTILVQKKKKISLKQTIDPRIFELSTTRDYLVFFYKQNIFNSIIKNEKCFFNLKIFIFHNPKNSRFINFHNINFQISITRFNNFEKFPSIIMNFNEFNSNVTNISSNFEKFLKKRGFCKSNCFEIFSKMNKHLKYSQEKEEFIFNKKILNKKIEIIEQNIKQKKKNSLGFLELPILNSENKYSYNDKSAEKKSENNQSKFYFKWDGKFIRIYFQRKLTGKKSIKKLNYCEYTGLDGKRDYCEIINPVKIKKVSQILHLDSEIQIKRTLSSYIHKENQWSGKKLCFKNVEIKRKKTINLSLRDLRALKITLLSNLKNKFLINNFNCKEIHENFHFKNFGRCYIKIFYFKPKKNFLMKVYYFIAEILPICSKNKLYKIIFNSEDLKLLSGNQIYANAIFDDDRLLLNFLNKFFFSKVRFSLSILQKRPKIPFKKFSSQINFDLEMEIKPIFFENYFPKYLLKKKLNITRVIYSGIINIEKSYCIITIKKNNILNIWNITIYFPKSSKVLSNNLTSNDISNKIHSDITSSLKIFVDLENQFINKRVKFFEFCREFNLEKNSAPLDLYNAEDDPEFYDEEEDQRLLESKKLGNPPSQIENYFEIKVLK